MIYVKEFEDHLPGLYYLVYYKNYHKKENLYIYALTIRHLLRFICTFNKQQYNKLAANLFLINSAMPKTRLLLKSIKFFLSFLSKKSETDLQR